MKVLKLLLLVFVMYTLGCSYSDNMPELPDDSVSDQELISIKNLYRKRSEGLVSYQVLYRVDQSEPAMKFRYAAVFNSPDSFRLEALPLQGFYSMGLFIQIENWGLFIDQNEQLAVSSESAESLLKDYMGIPIRPEYVSPILAGRLPSNVLGGNNYSWFRLPSNNMAIVRSDMSEYWELQDITGHLLRVQLRDRSERLFADIYVSDYEQGGDVYFPSKVKIDVPLLESVVLLETNQIKLNNEIKDSLFHPVIPSSFRRYQHSPSS